VAMLIEPDPDLRGGVNAGDRSRREQLLELLVFLFLITPSMGLSFLVVRQGNLSFTLTAWGTILRDVGLVALIFFFLWRNSESRAQIGWAAPQGARDALLGVLLFFPVLYATNALDQLLRALGFSSPATPLPRALTAGDLRQFVLAGVLVAVVAVAEEIIFRGYLIRRLTAVTGSTAAAVILSSVIFSLGHGYEGTAGVVSVGFMGMLFAIVYLWRRSLMAPMVMHFLQDFIGIVLVPLFQHHK
jgi:membrane protease YdiL (CAAX protease family)